MEDFTGPELRSRRLLLTPFRRIEADALLTVFRDAGVRRYLLDDLEVSRQWVLAEIDASAARFRENGAGLWTARLSRDGEIIGFGGFREFFDPPQLQLLYGLLPGHWGQGLATEMAVRLCRQGFAGLGFRTIRAATDAPNHASIRVLEKLGMRRTDSTPADDATVFFTLDRQDAGPDLVAGE